MLARVKSVAQVARSSPSNLRRACSASALSILRTPSFRNGAGIAAAVAATTGPAVATGVGTAVAAGIAAVATGVTAAIPAGIAAVATGVAAAVAAGITTAAAGVGGITTVAAGAAAGPDSAPPDICDGPQAKIASKASAAANRQAHPSLLRRFNILCNSGILWRGNPSRSGKHAARLTASSKTTMGMANAGMQFGFLPASDPYPRLRAGLAGQSPAVRRAAIVQQHGNPYHSQAPSHTHGGLPPHRGNSNNTPPRISPDAD